MLLIIVVLLLALIALHPTGFSITHEEILNLRSKYEPLEMYRGVFLLNLEVTINFIHFLTIWKRTLPYRMVVYSFISVLSTHQTLFKEQYIKMYCLTKTSLAQSWVFSPGSLWSEEKGREGGQRKKNVCRTCD